MPVDPRRVDLNLLVALLLELPTHQPRLLLRAWWNPAAEDPGHVWLRELLVETARGIA